MRNKILQTQLAEYDSICNQLVDKFVKKHGYEFSCWISDSPGTIAVFIDQYFFNMTDIIEDLKGEYKKEEIFRWQDYCLECHYENRTAVNLHAYIKGMR